VDRRAQFTSGAVRLVFGEDIVISAGRAVGAGDNQIGPESETKLKSGTELVEMIRLMMELLPLFRFA